MSSQLKDLPELIRPKQAQIILGLSKKKYYVLAESIPDFVIRLPGERGGRVRKTALLSLLKLT